MYVSDHGNEFDGYQPPLGSGETLDLLYSMGVPTFRAAERILNPDSDICPLLVAFLHSDGLYGGVMRQDMMASGQPVP